MIVSFLTGLLTGTLCGIFVSALLGANDRT